METKPELLGRCLTTIRAQCRGPVPCPGAFAVPVRAARSLQGSSGPRLHCGPAGAPVSASVSRAGRVGKLHLLSALRHRDVTRSSLDVQEGLQARQRLLCDLSLSKRPRKSSRQHFGITFKLLESSCIFPCSSLSP